MPQYSYTRDGKTITIVQGVNENHSHFIDENGNKWDREYSIPQIAIDTNIDPLSSKDFSEKMGKKRNGTIGQLWDQSKELSIKREEICGKDQVKENFYKNYQQRRKGREHPDIRKQKILDSLKKKDVIVEE